MPMHHLSVSLLFVLALPSAWASVCDADFDAGVEESALLQHRLAVDRDQEQELTVKCGSGRKRALMVVGSKPDEPLYADLVFQERLTIKGFDVTLIQDLNVTNADCEAYDVMLVSASIGAGNVKHRLDDCTTPQMIWEVGLYNFNGMSGPTNDDAWVTSQWWNTYHQDSWDISGYWPPAPTGRDILVTQQGAKSPLAAGFGGLTEFFSVDNYGVNWAQVDKLGSGAKVIATLPPDSTKDWPSESAPKVDKAVLFYYEKGDELFCGRGKSPAFRIGFPPYSFIYGPDPTCEELAAVPPCAACKSECKTVEETVTSDTNPMPLSCNGVKMLDAAIDVLHQESHKCKT